MDYDFLDDEDILDENDASNFQANNRNKQQPQKTVDVKKSAAQPKQQSNINYDDIDFSDDDNMQQQYQSKQQAQIPSAKQRTDDIPQKQQIPSSSGLPLIQPARGRQLSNDEDAHIIQQSKQSGASSAAAAITKNDKQKNLKKEPESDELDDLDDIVDAQSPLEQKANKQTNNKQHNGYNAGNHDYDDDQQYYEDADEQNGDDDQQQQKEDGDDDVQSELSDLPELQYDDEPKKQAASPIRSYHQISNPIALENRSSRTQNEAQRLPPRGSQLSEKSNRTNERRMTVDSVGQKTGITGISGTSNRTGAHSRDSRMKPPTIPVAALRKNAKKSAATSADELALLLQDKNYDAMTYKEIKAESDALRDKLRSFNTQLTEKIENIQPQINKQVGPSKASNGGGSSSQPRSRSNQMRTADAETDNNTKISKRLEEELTKLMNRQSVVENPQYTSNLKVQIETSQNLINKFKLQIKQITLKNDQQAKELSKKSKDDGNNDGVKEGFGVQQELQSYYDKIKELEKKRGDFDDLFTRKNDVLEQKESEYQKKVREAKALGVSLNFDGNQQKRIAKHRELQKTFDQLEKNNVTLAKMQKTKEVLFYREMDEIAKDVMEKENEIRGYEASVIALKSQIQNSIENEKIYPNKNLKEFLERETNVNQLENNYDSVEAVNSARKNNPLRNNQFVSPDHSERHSGATPVTDQLSKPNMKFKKLSEDRTSQQSRAADETVTSATNLPTNDSGINFHQKLQSRTNLNDISNQEEVSSSQPVSTKPFSLKKGGAGGMSEPRIWKPNNQQSQQSAAIAQPQQQLQQQAVYSANDQLGTPSSKGNPNSFNFKQKLATQSSQAELQKEAQNSAQENVMPPSTSVVTASGNAASYENDFFEKPQRMFKFKRGGDNNTQTVNPADSSQQEVKQETINPLPKEEGYTFSTNSRVSRVRGNNQKPSSELNQQAEEPRPIEQQQLNNNNTITTTTKPVSETVGYQFSGAYQANSSNNTVPRRRGGNPPSSGFENDFAKNEPSSSQPVKTEENVEINIASRRNRGSQQLKNDYTFEPANNKPASPKNDTAEAEKKQVHTEVESQWSWNNNTSSNTATTNNVPTTSALDTPFTSEPAPKTFNFKRNVQAPQVTEQPAVVQVQTQQQQPSVFSEQPAVQPPANIAEKPINQMQKKDDQYTFKGPSDRRMPVNKTAANEVKKVIKRDIFADEPADISAPTSFMAPKEIGSTQQASVKPQFVAATNKKSPLDDDDDNDDVDGLDFLKQGKPKVNYNDDDDLFGGAAKKPQQQQQQQSAAPGKAGDAMGAFGGPSKLTVKSNIASKQEKEKNLASKANNDDFFDDLF